MKKLRDLADIARKHHQILKIKDDTRIKGMVYTFIAWILYAFFTALVDRLSPEFHQHVSSKSLFKLFSEFTVIYVVMFIYFLICCLVKGIKLKSSEPSLIMVRSIAALISFYCYSFARIWTGAIDNSLLFSTDAIWILVMLHFLKIKIGKYSKYGIVVGFFGLIFVIFRESSSIYNLFGAFFGIGSGFTLGLIKVITPFLIKQDPPFRIGLYHGGLGFIASLLMTIIIGIFCSSWSMPAFSEISVPVIMGLILSTFPY